MYSVEKTIEIVNELGFKAIELAAVRPHIWYPEDYSKEDIKCVKEAVDSVGLKIVGLHTDDGSPHTSTLVHQNEKARRWKINNLRTNAELASMLGTGMITTTPGYSLTIGTRKEAAWEWAKQGLAEAARACANYGVIIGLEPCPGTIVADSRDGIRMLEDLNLDNVKLILDTGHAMMTFHSSWRENGPHPVDAIYESKKYLEHLHANDNNGINDEHAVPGTGVIDFEAVIKALYDIGYNGYVSLEIVTRDPRKGFKDGKLHLEKYLRR
jgi:protein FrlC